MIFRKMRLLCKRHLLGNLLAVSLCAVLLAVYVTLLRYNKASSTTFNLVSKRHSHRETREVRGNGEDHRQYHNKNRNPNENMKLKGQKRRGDTRNGKKSVLEAFIVEEHHQVIPIWMKALSSGTISQYNNTLIHIDGHSDMALPYLVPGYPFFRVPRNEKELNRMIQRNDNFIIQAAMVGMFKRVIWIWPKWNTDEKLQHEITDIEVGYANVIIGEALREKVICVCTSTSGVKKECEFISLNTASRTEEPIKNIAPKNCHIKRSFIFEAISESLALEKLRLKTWLNNKEKVLLDIDEDYYGCTYASQPLVDYGVKLTVLEQMNNVLKQLFCPKTLKEETDIDNLLYKVLGIFLNSDNCQEKHNKQNGHCRNSSQKSQAVRLMKTFTWEEGRSVSCVKRSRQTDNLMVMLVELFFSHMNQKQLRTLQYVGFCLSTSVNSYIPISNPEFHICMGNNNAKETAVLVHKPIKKEITYRTTLLGKMLETLKGSKLPQIITVCRSFRDGYIPRGFFKMIEKDIIKSLNNAFGSVKYHYDVELLGGKKGWLGRHAGKH